MKKAITAIMITLFLASTLSMAFNIAPVSATPDSGIVGLWHFDESTGFTASDSSGYGNDGTLSGGKFGNALYFDGVDDYVNIPDNPTLDLTEDITLEAWILIKSFSTSEGLHMYIIGKDSAGQRSYGIGVDLTWMYPKKPFVIIFHPGGSYKIAWGTNDLVIDQWYHIAGVFDAINDKLTLYVDGVSQPTVTDTSSINPGNADLRIGGREYAGHGCYFNGLIDEVRISDAVRYTSTFAPSNAPFSSDSSTVGLWHFDESTGSIAFDESDNHNDGTIYGASWAGPTWTTGNFGGALNFDGNDDYVDVPDSAVLEPNHVSVELWINRLGSPGNNKYIVSKHYGSGWNSYALRAYSSGVQFYIGTTSTWYGSPTSVSIWDGNWHHVVGTFDGSIVRLYVDGSEVGSGTPVPVGTSVAYDGAGINVGGPGDLWLGGPYHIGGEIDEVRIWNRALSVEEVKRHAWGLVGEWLFDMGSGSTAYDTSGFGNQGTIVGTPTWVAGKFGSALEFDGSNYVDLGLAVDDILDEEVTLEAWIKPDTKQRGGIISSDVTYYSPHKGFDFFLWDDDSCGRLYLDFGDGTTLGRMWYSIPSMDWYNKWHHVAGTWDGSAMKLYVDGVEIPELSHTGPYADSDKTNLIGAISYTSVIWKFDGEIDEVRIWNQALIPIKFDQTGLDYSATGELVVTVSDPIELEYEDLPYVMMVEGGTEVTYTYEQSVSSNIIGKRFSLDSVTGGASPSDTITVIDPTTITGNYVTHIEASVDIDPDTLNLKSNGQWITAYITLPEGYSVEDINVNTVELKHNDELVVIGNWSEVQDGILMVKFERSALTDHLGAADVSDGGKFYPVTLIVTGFLDGTPFEGIDTINVLKK